MGDHLGDDLGALRGCAIMALNHRVLPERLVMLTHRPYLSGLLFATVHGHTVKLVGPYLNHALRHYSAVASKLVRLTQ
jgi:hypothetical protein